MAAREKAAIRGNGVFHCRGKRIFRSEAVVRRENTKATQCEPDGNGAVRLRRAAEIAATVQIKQRGVRGIRRFEPLAGNSIYVGRCNAHGVWDFTRKRTENRTRDAIIPALPQAALDAPLRKPNREMSLKACHDKLPLPGCAKRVERIPDICCIERRQELGEESSGEGLGVPAGMG